MRRPRQPGSDRFPWFVLIAAVVIQAALGALFLRDQRAKDLHALEDGLDANLQVVVGIVHFHLQNAHYQEIKPLLENWVGLFGENVVSLRLTAANGFVLFQTGIPDEVDSIVGRSVEIPYSYRGRATLDLRWSTESVRARARSTLAVLAVILVVTSAALGFLLRNIFLRRRHTLVLAGEKEQLLATLRSLAEGVIRIDRDGTILLVNTSAERMLGCSLERCRGRHLDDVLHLSREGSEEPCRIFASGLLGACRESGLELEFRGDEGRATAVGVGCSPVGGQDGPGSGWVVVLRDLSGARNLEMEQHRNAMLRALGVVAGGIAHDFNNLLMAIRANLSLALEKGREGAEVRDLLVEAEKASDRATDLTRQLLTFARGGSPILDASAVDEVIREAAEFVTRGAELNLKFDFEEGLRPVLADRFQIGQVIQNLVINARQAMPTGGVLEIACRNAVRIRGGREEPIVTITVRDEGEGIPPENLDKIFDPYFTTKMEGSGLGLALTYSIISRHGGRIEVDSIPGRGTTFTIELPATSREPGPAAVDEGSLVRGSGRILVMDDDAPVRMITGRLARQLGFDPVEAADGREAVALYAEALRSARPIDLVILDLTVRSGMGGLDTLAELVKIDPACRAIVASGYSNDPVVANHRQHGFAGALPKPFDLRKLSAEIGRVLGLSGDQG